MSMTTMETVSIQDNEFLRQFETRKRGCLASIEYSIQERKIFLTKMVVPEEIKGAEFESSFIRAVLDHLQEQGQSVVPTCAAIAKFLRANKRYRDLLPVGVRL